MNDSTPERNLSPSAADDGGSGPVDDVVGEAEFYINEDDAPRRWRRVPVPHGPKYYARMARTWGLVSVLLAGAHVVLYLLGRAG